MICSIFGQLNMTIDIKPMLKATLTDLITKRHVKCFYIGGKTAFDKAAKEVIRELAKESGIAYRTVTAGLPEPSPSFAAEKHTPEEISSAAAIRFMLNSCDTAVLCYTVDCGERERLIKAARKMGKEVYEGILL